MIGLSKIGIAPRRTLLQNYTFATCYRVWLAVGLLSALLMACGATDTTTQPDRPLSVWAWGTGAKALAYEATEYNRQYPSVRLNIENLDRQTLYDRLTKALEAGGVGLPDVVVIETARLQSYAGTFPEAFLNLSDLDGRYATDFNPGQWEGSKFLGRLRSLPWTLGLAGLFYRADLFEKAGVGPERLETWDDFIAAAQQVQGANPGLRALAFDPGEFFQVIMAQQGATFFTPEDRINLTSPPALRAAWLLQKVSQAGLLLNIADDLARREAARLNGVASIVGGLEESYNLTSQLPTQSRQWRVLPLPALDRGGPRLSSLGGLTLAIPRTNSRTAQARAFVEFCALNKTNGATVFEKFGLWPSYKPASTEPVFNAPSPFFGNQTPWQPFLNRLNELPPLYYNGDYPKTLEALRQIQTDLLNGTDPTTTLNQAAQTLKRQTNREIASK